LFNINKGEFQQSINLTKKDDKTYLGLVKGLMIIDDDAWEERWLTNMKKSTGISAISLCNAIKVQIVSS